MKRPLLAVLGCGSAPLMENRYVQKAYLFLLSHTQNSQRIKLCLFLLTSFGFWQFNFLYLIFIFAKSTQLATPERQVSWFPSKRTAPCWLWLSFPHWPRRENSRGKRVQRNVTQMLYFCSWNAHHSLHTVFLQLEYLICLIIHTILNLMQNAIMDVLEQYKCV